ncbi:MULTISPECIES: hypothetical protein [unclassified Corynebacterium]|uniref:hypothetical protein n=1 Tax=unclassified Corynebacterium TaxID=2624378 RepID=UPI0008A1E1D0|nr:MULTISPECIES: hypothetical protein [unclassified Corynebacterium]OFN75933.1 hypothetical protein HMPREF2537_11870 [Corynebacterium sp. HMSC074E01]OFP63008.1 hypothetical protein HMPREF2978_12410 [Corynebacterium sp. HMSC074C01]OHO65020.1 hypothetical protein HMPREF2743_07565 [Corynebacterium sp. HMSC036D02]
MAEPTPRSSRPRRRRAQRPSTAENYDRSFDVPSGPVPHAASAVAGSDELRTVNFDGDTQVPGGDGDDDVTGEAFYRENMPPHFGTTQ